MGIVDTTPRIEELCLEDRIPLNPAMIFGVNSLSSTFRSHFVSKAFGFK